MQPRPQVLSFVLLSCAQPMGQRDTARPQRHTSSSRQDRSESDQFGCDRSRSTVCGEVEANRIATPWGWELKGDGVKLMCAHGGFIQLLSAYVSVRSFELLRRRPPLRSSVIRCAYARSIRPAVVRASDVAKLDARA